MSQKGSHTWDIIYHYHQCPKCGYIVESRQDFEFKGGVYSKILACPRCQCTFKVTKSVASAKRRPWFGQPEPGEVQW